MRKENRIVSYPNPNIVKKINDMAQRTNLTKSKIVKEALTDYFNKKKTSN